MDCCSRNDLDKTFGRNEAQKELKNYLRKGLSRWSRALRDAVLEHGVSGATILEIGSGIGALHMELLKAGATTAVGIDISPAQIDAARTLARQQGLEDAVVYHVTDFVESAEEFVDADIVILDKVICCYPNMPALVTASAKHSRRVLALAYPRVAWPMRLVALLINTYKKVARSGFRFYLHSRAEVHRIAASLGFAQVFLKTSGPLGILQIALYERPPSRPNP